MFLNQVNFVKLLLKLDVTYNNYRWREVREKFAEMTLRNSRNRLPHLTPLLSLAIIQNTNLKQAASQKRIFTIGQC